MTPTTDLGLSIRLSMFELRETGDWDIFLGPPERARAETGGADQWVLKRRECSGFARVNKVTSASLGYPLSVLNKNSTLKRRIREIEKLKRKIREIENFKRLRVLFACIFVRQFHVVKEGRGGAVENVHVFKLTQTCGLLPLSYFSLEVCTRLSKCRPRTYFELVNSASESHYTWLVLDPIWTWDTLPYLETRTIFLLGLGTYLIGTWELQRGVWRYRAPEFDNVSVKG